jgi:hypothetical protein
MQKFPPLEKGGKGGFSWKAQVRNPPRPPLIKGGQKSPAVNSCNNVWNAFSPNETRAAEALVGNIFALVESIYETPAKKKSEKSLEFLPAEIKPFCRLFGK